MHNMHKGCKITLKMKNFTVPKFILNSAVLQGSYGRWHMRKKKKTTHPRSKIKLRIK